MGDQAPLESLAEINPRSPSARIGESISFVAMADVSEQGYLENVHVRPAAPGYTSFVEGDVLLAKITPCMENGKGAHVRELPVPQAQGSTEFHVLRARPGTSDRFLYHLTRTESFRLRAEALMTGSAGQRRVPTEFFSMYLVHVPPLEEQRRIAEILDTIGETIQATERVIAKLEVGRQGLLDDLLRQIEHHERLGEALDRIDAGWSPACAERPPTGSEWGVLKVSSITREEFNPAASKTLPPSLPPRPDLIVRVGDVLTARANGVADLVGRTAFVDHLGGRNLLISDKTLRLVPGPRLSPRYLSYCMQHEMVRSQVRGLISGSTGQGNISQAELRSLRLAIPPRSEQHAIETAVGSVDARLEAERSALSKLHRLRAGLAADLLSVRVRTVAA